MHITSIFILFFIIFFSNHNIFCEESDVSKQVRQWFEWGEYPQIIQTVPEYLSKNKDSIDSLSEAEFHLYLGVAYFTEGEVGKARDEFLASLHLNPAITLDEKYVSHEIFDLFLTTRKEKKEHDLLLQQNIELSQQNIAVKDSLGKREKIEKKRGFLFAAITSTVLSVGFAGVAGYEYHLGDEEYERFLNSADEGDLREYNRLKDNVEMYDVGTALAGAASAVCAVTGVVFFIVARKQRSKNVAALFRNMNINISYNEVIVSFDF